MSIALQCEFWAVGQGLFSSGKVLSGGNTAFSWVYDCGSTPDKKTKQTKELDLAIQQMKSQYNDLDLLAISHFDQDHINGISKLLSKYQKVKYILLPYYPLWQRLIIAKYLGVTSDSPNFNFFIDPVKFIIDQFHQIETILLLPSNDQYIPEEPIAPNSKELIFNTIDTQNNEFENRSYSKKVKWLEPKTRLIFDRVEFVPYNTPFDKLKIRPANKSNFQQDVAKLIAKKSLNIQAIKNLYDKYFTHKLNKSYSRNIISLFLYISYLNKSPSRIISYQETENKRSAFLFSNNAWNVSSLNKDYRDAILYSGDAFLNAKYQLNDLFSVLGKKRIDRIACFQVAHHGSKYNWQKGLANQLKPYISIFCADPDAGYHHPHSPVVFDFIQHNPILVDKQNTLRIFIN
ncbi:MBL fold metallo-hydrolase [Ursidibacter sp. B-7004-1]